MQRPSKKNKVWFCPIKKNIKVLYEYDYDSCGDNN
jgi:hypothetical protein